MQIIEPIATAQSVTIVTRPTNGLLPTITVTPEGGSEIVSVIANGIVDGSYFTFDLSADFKNETFYAIRLFTSTLEIYRGLFFCTDKTDIEHISIYKKSGNYIEV